MNIHASLVALGGHGVLIRGAARAGKSALALCLIRLAQREGNAAALVADDQVLLSQRGGHVWGHTPPALTGLLEISGVGIVTLPSVPEARISLIAELTDQPPRLPETEFDELAGAAVRRIYLPARQATLGAEIILSLLDPGGWRTRHDDAPDRLTRNS